MRRALTAGLLAFALVGCSSAPTDETPSGAVRLFLDAMARGEREPEAVREAYELLSAPTRLALQERAHVAVQVGAHPLEPWEMIARSRYRQTFSVREGARGMREAIDGDQATVTVRSADGRRSAEVPLVREEGAWRIVLAIPPLHARTGTSADAPAPSGED